MSEEELDYGQDVEDLGEEDDYQVEERDILPPNDFKKQLLACVHCYFILAKAQWSEYDKCPNCLEFTENPKPTSKFTGITCITNPSKSWQTNRMRVVKRIAVKVPGAYAININEDYDNNQNNY